MIVVDSLITVDGDEVFLRITSQLAVEIVCCNDSLLVLGKSACCLLYDGEYLGHHLVEGILIDFKYFLLDFIDLGKDIGTLVDWCILDGCL